MGFSGYWPALQPLLRPGDVLLHPGCGNSLFSRQALEADDCPADVIVVNCDLCLPVVDSMRDAARQWPSRLQERVTFEQQDVCCMTFTDASFSVIFDKGMLDAFFSNTEDERGTNANVQRYVVEAYRVLKPGGRFIIISTNNDTDLVRPYLYDQDWDVACQPLEVDRLGEHCTGRRVKGPRTLYTLYHLTKPPDAP
eukprot:EG_transcript_30281